MAEAKRRKELGLPPREKNVERSELATILEELFLHVIAKEYGDSSYYICIVNLDKGEIG